MLPERLPDFPFRASRHDRLAERRSDRPFLDEAWSDPASRVLVMRGTDLATRSGGLGWVGTDEAPPGERMLLGATGGVVHFLLLTDPSDAAFDAAADASAAGAAGTDRSADFAGLRRLGLGLDATDASLAVHATALAGWHLRHRMCSVCGAGTEPEDAGASRRCPACGALHFPRTDPAVIMAVIDAEDRCLLGHNAARPPGWFSTLAGFVEPGESPEQAVAREVGEETGIQVRDVAYRGAQPWPFPSSLMLGYYAEADGTEIAVDGQEVDEARWFSRLELAKAIDAGEVGLPTAISISYALIAGWYGGDLPANRLTPPEPARGR